MRKLAVLLVSALVAVPAAFVRGQDATPPTTTVPAAVHVPTQTTTVRGSVPDLTGRWLALAALHLPGDRVRVAPALWEVGTKDGRPELLVHFADLPPALQTAIDKQHEAGVEWVPSADDLQTLAAAWATLPPREAQLAQLETTLAAPDGFDEPLRNEPKTKDALWVATQLITFAASAAPAVRQVQVYAAREATPDRGYTGRGYTGYYVSTTIAAAPFPIPITFEGSFRLYRLTARVPGFMQRLLDVFSGCGRT